MSDFSVKHLNTEEIVDEFTPLHHSSKPGRKGFLTAVSRLFQHLEDSVFDAYVGNSLDHAKGKVLDFYGFLAGVPRAGLTDYWYRFLIKAAYQAKRCTGSVNELILLWKTAAADPTYVEFTRYKKNCIILTAWRDRPLPYDYARRAAELVAGACPIGSVVLLESPLVFVGSSLRTYAPFAATVTSSALPARVWWPQS